MYAALWRALPGPRAVKAVQALVLVLAAVAFCFLWLFPRISPHMPFNDNTVDSSGRAAPHAAAPRAPAPHAAAPRAAAPHTATPAGEYARAAVAPRTAAAHP